MSITGNALNLPIPIPASELVLSDIMLAQSQVTNLTSSLAAKLNLTGGTLTGVLTLNADATASLQPVTLQQLNNAVLGAYKLQGGYNPTGTSLYPVAANTTNPVSATVLAGMIWNITVAGTINGISVDIGDQVVALINSPGQTNANWNIIDNNIGYMPLSNVLNSANIFVGNASNIATGVAASGDININNTGAFTIQSGTVTLAKMANLATANFIGRNTAGTGVPESLSTATAKTMLNLSGTNSGDVTVTGQNYLSLSGQAITANAIDLSGTNVSGILPAANGGTANGFTGFSGPAGTTKTFTLPNASSTILTDNAAITPTQGGTGITSYAIGDLVYASAATTLSRLADVATGNALISGGIGAAPSWSKISLTTTVSGILPGANGGTNNGFFQITGPTTALKTFTFPDASATVLTTNALVTVPQGGTGIASGTSGGIPYFSSTTTIVSSGALTANTLVLGGGAGTTPSTLTAGLGTTTQVLHGNAAGQPTWGAVSLTADVTGILPPVNGGTGTTTAFTPGSVIFSGTSGSYTQDNGNLFYDGTNKFLGIGTNAPHSQLQLGNTTGNRKITLYEVANNSTQVYSIGVQTNNFMFMVNQNTTDYTWNYATGVGTSAQLVIFKGTGLNGFGTSSPVNCIDANGAIAIGSAVAGVTTAPANGLLVQGSILNQALTASSLVATDGSKNLTSTTTGISPTFSGLTISSTGTVSPTIQSTTTGSLNVTELGLNRGDLTNGYANINYKTAGTSNWLTGLRFTSTDYQIYNVNIGGPVLTVGYTTNDVTATIGNMIVNTAGSGLRVKEGSNAKQGTATLVTGTVTVSNTSVTANSRIFLTGQNSSGTAGALTISARVAGTSFTITSTNALDTRLIAYQIFEPA